MYTIQNNLVYVAMSMLDPPTFQLWACWKLIPAGLFARCMLGQRLSRVQWVALVLLALGMATTKLTARAGHGTWRQTQGIGVLLVNGCLSGASGVTNEYLIKLSDPRAPLMFKVHARAPPKPAPHLGPISIAMRAASRRICTSTSSACLQRRPPSAHSKVSALHPSASPSSPFNRPHFPLDRTIVLISDLTFLTF